MPGNLIPRFHGIAELGNKVVCMTALSWHFHVTWQPDNFKPFAACLKWISLITTTGTSCCHTPGFRRTVCNVSNNAVAYCICTRRGSGFRDKAQHFPVIKQEYSHNYVACWCSSKSIAVEQRFAKHVGCHIAISRILLEFICCWLRSGRVPSGFWGTELAFDIQIAVKGSC